jgi:hypothetical protein
MRKEVSAGMALAGGGPSKSTVPAAAGPAVAGQNSIGKYDTKGGESLRQGCRQTGDPPAIFLVFSPQHSLMLILSEST